MNRSLPLLYKPTLNPSPAISSNSQPIIDYLHKKQTLPPPKISQKRFNQISMAVILSSNSMTGTSFSLPASFKFNSKHALNSIQSQSIIVSAYGKSAYPPPPSPPPLAMASSSTLYEVLGIQATATCHEIKTAYRKLARICHPDVVAMNQKDNSAAEFMKIHAAYTILSDPDKRANYDRGLIFGSRRHGLSATVATSSRPTSPLSGYTCRRTWETDQCW